MARVVLAMSGGVDSSVAAHLLQRQGHEVIGLFMRRGEQSDEGGAAARSSSMSSFKGSAGGAGKHQGCCSAEDARDARRVADKLDIPFYVVDFQAEFSRIIDYFVNEYGRGCTPNPCIVCNRWLKFGRLFDYAESVEARYVATGHYARCTLGDDGTPWLSRGLDRDKDQSYALFGVDPARLRRIMLPVGAFRKAEIRQLASELGLGVADKGESQDICFVRSGHHGEFVQKRLGNRDTSGHIVTTEGAVVGHHSGIEQFTVGQRKGLGVAMGVPYFVIRIDPQRHDVIIGRRDQLTRQSLTAAKTNWLAPPPTEPIRCHAKIRYNTPGAPATVSALSQDRLHVRFDQPVRGVAPGQAVVCYNGDRVLGGGWIESQD
ncbi:MAG: tRNA 2-thiouridine(34) synthase MnmA [Planctomycetota bacterium]